LSRDISVIFTLKDRFSNGLNYISKQQKQFKTDTEATKKQLDSLYLKQWNLKMDNKTADKALKTLEKSADKLDDKLKNELDQTLKKKREIKLQMKQTDSAINATMKKLSEMDRKKVEPEIRIKDNASRPLDSIKNKMANILKWGAMAVAAGVTAGGTAGIIHSLNIAGQMEQTQMAFETMLKSREAGQKMMRDLTAFAIDTPFEFMDLSKNAQYAMAMGFKQDDMLSLLTDAGDAASGTGRGTEGMENIIRALGQMQQKGKVSAQEINQLAENGIGAWRYIAGAIGKTTAETMKLAENGLIPADKAIQSIRKGMRQDYSGMMIKQSRTLFGLVSSFKDFANLNIFAAFGGGIKDGILPYMTKFLDGLNENEDGLEKMQSKLIEVGKTIGDWVGKKADALYRYFDKLFNNPAFMNADLGGKIKFILEDMYQGVKTWFDGEGGEKLQNAFADGTRAALDLIIDVATEYVPKFATLGLQIGGAMGKGITDSLVGSNPTIEAEGKTYDMPQDPLFGILNNITDKAFGDSENPILRALFRDPFKHLNKPKAFGMSRVPYNNYPALLHEGEKVLTKQETNQSSGDGSVIVNMNGPITIREEGDIKKVAIEFKNELIKAKLAFGGAF
jgi:tape measure domain-containing protein